MWYRKGTFVNRMIILTKKIRKNISVLLNYLRLKMLELGSFRNIQLSSQYFYIFKTYIFKGKLTTTVQLFCFQNAGMFFKNFDCIQYRITVLFGNFSVLDVKAIYSTFDIRPKDLCKFIFFQNSCIFVFLIGLAQKLHYLLHANSLINEFSFLKLLKKHNSLLNARFHERCLVASNIFFLLQDDEIQLSYLQET